MLLVLVLDGFVHRNLQLAHCQPARMPSQWSPHSGHPEFSKFWDCSTEPCASPGPCRVETEDPSTIQMRDCAENMCWNRYKNEGIEEKREKNYTHPKNDWKSILCLLISLGHWFLENPAPSWWAFPNEVASSSLHANSRTSKLFSLA